MEAGAKSRRHFPISCVLKESQAGEFLVIVTGTVEEVTRARGSPSKQWRG
jgi:hypothetical protein